MKTKFAAVVISAMIVLAPLAACGSKSADTEDRDIDSGVVYSSRGKYVKVREDDGENDTHKVSKSVARKCTVGKRWPDCKR